MSENIKKCDDGTYRWVYEFDMLKNPIILLTVLKIFLIVLFEMNETGIEVGHTRKKPVKSRRKALYPRVIPKTVPQMMVKKL